MAPPGLWDRLERLVRADCYAVERGPCRAANGYTDPANRVIRVRDDVAPLQACKAFIHELGHVRAEHPQRFAEEYHRSSVRRGIAEVEAESIAYVALAASNLDSSDHAIPYVATWSDGDTRVVQDTARSVIETA